MMTRLLANSLIHKNPDSLVEEQIKFMAAIFGVAVAIFPPQSGLSVFRVFTIHLDFEI